MRGYDPPSKSLPPTFIGAPPVSYFFLVFLQSFFCHLFVNKLYVSLPSTPPIVVSRKHNAIGYYLQPYPTNQRCHKVSLIPKHNWINTEQRKKHPIHNIKPIDLELKCIKNNILNNYCYSWIPIKLLQKGLKLYKNSDK